MGKAAVIFHLIIFDQIISLIHTGFDDFPRYPEYANLFLNIVFNRLDIFHIDRNNMRVSIIGFRVDILYQFIIRFYPGKMSIYFYYNTGIFEILIHISQKNLIFS